MHAYGPGGVEPAGWPKFTGGWTQATPSVGDTDGDGTLEVAALTREGWSFLWETGTDACDGSNEEWWTFHHDEFGSANYGTDARPPGTAEELELADDGTLSWTAPGDDWLCGDAERFEVRASDAPIEAPGDGEIDRRVRRRPGARRRRRVRRAHRRGPRRRRPRRRRLPRRRRQLGPRRERRGSRRRRPRPGPARTRRSPPTRPTRAAAAPALGRPGHRRRPRRERGPQPASRRLLQPRRGQLARRPPARHRGPRPPARLQGRRPAEGFWRRRLRGRRPRPRPDRVWTGRGRGDRRPQGHRQGLRAHQEELSRMRGMGFRGRLFAALVSALALSSFAVAPALADFPYARPGANEADYSDLYVTTQVPGDIGGDSNEFKYAASPDPANFLVNSKPGELGGIRGASVVDADASRDTAWEMTTGRPDVAISVLDSGIKWDDAGAMNDLRFKVRLTAASCRRPHHDRATALVAGADCADLRRQRLRRQRRRRLQHRRLRLRPARRRHRPATATARRHCSIPQDVLIAFTDGIDADGNGYVDDIVGWDFLDDDNDPFDDVSVRPRHRRGRGLDRRRPTTAARVGSCPNCVVVPLRVGDSFVADVNRFAAGRHLRRRQRRPDRPVGPRHAQQLQPRARGDRVRLRPRRDRDRLGRRRGRPAQQPAEPSAHHPRELGHAVRRDDHPQPRPTFTSTAAPTSTRRSPSPSPASAAPRMRSAAPPAWPG